LDLGELHRTRQSFGALSALALDVALPALVLVVTNGPARIDSRLNLSEKVPASSISPSHATRRGSRHAVASENGLR